MTIAKLIKEQLGLRGLKITLTLNGWIRIDDKYNKVEKTVNLFSIEDDIKDIKGIIQGQRKAIKKGDL